MDFKKLSKKKIINNMFIFIILNIISLGDFYNSSLLKVNYIFQKDNIYINAFSNSKNDLYFEIFGNNNGDRYFYGLNSTNGKEILFNNNNILKLKFSYISKYHESGIIDYENNEDYIFTFNPEYSEFINIKNGDIYYKKSDDIIFSNPFNKASYKNKITKLHDNNYLISIIGKQFFTSYIYISIFTFQSNNIEGFKKVKDIDGISTDYLNITDCFQTEKQYYECLYNRIRSDKNKINVQLYDLNFNKQGEVTLGYTKGNSFTKFIHIKKEIAAYIFFDYDTNIPIIKVKYLENFSLINQFNFESFELNGNGAYTLNYELFLSDAIKINDNRFVVIFTGNNLSYFLICLFEIYNNDQSFYLRYFILDLNQKNIKISINIKSFIFRDFFGVAFYDSNNKYPGIFIFSYPIIINDHLFLFTKESTNIFSLYDNLEMSNNILGYELNFVYVINFNETEKSGVILFSDNKKDILSINDILNLNDNIIFKEYNNQSIPGVYTLELMPNIKEPDYNIFESLSIDKYYDEKVNYDNYYNPKVFNGSIITLKYIVLEECNTTFHIDKLSHQKVCYEIDGFCLYEEYKYYLDDKNQCISGGCPKEYYQLNFECFIEGCPPGTIQKSSNSHMCTSIYNYCIIKETYKTECSDNLFQDYIYNYNNTIQFLRSCNDSLKYTLEESTTFLYNGICWTECPENTVPVIDIKECEDSIDDCINKGYIIFNNKCYVNESSIDNESKCPNLFYINDNNMLTCIQENYCIRNFPFENILTHKCFQNCESSQLLNGICKINNNYNTIDDLKLITENIEDVIHHIDIDNYTIFEGNNIKYEITSYENQAFTENFSFIDFGECASKIKSYYNIDDFIVLKSDIKNNDTLTPSVEYEIFHPENKSKLDLSICSDLKINIQLPAKLDEFIISQIEELLKYGYNLLNKFDKFYNDICAIFTSIVNTDMILSDRREKYYKDFDYYCENNCKFSSFNLTNKRVICQCPVKEEINYEMQVIKFNTTDLSSYFSIKTYANLACLKCYKLAFSKKGQYKNYGSYLIILLIIIYIVIMILFYYKYQIKIQKVINSALIDIYNINNPKKKHLQTLTKMESSNNSLKKNIIKEKKIFLKNSFTKARKNKKIGEKLKLNTVQEYSKNSYKSHNDESIKKHFIHKKKKIKIHSKKLVSYNDEELNNLVYDEALIFDKRTYIQYYISLMKEKHLILFTFMRKNDFNILLIKIMLFIFSFSFYFVSNALFFTDATMHKIFEDRGMYNFVFLLPKTIYSSIISVILNKIMKLLALSEKDLLKMRKEKDKMKEIEKSKEVFLCLKIKINIFCIVSLLLMMFFWYYMSCFCAVYINTKIILIEDTFMSFGISLIYPIFLYLLPGLFRIPSFKNNKRKTMYTIGKIIAYI